MKRLLTLGLYLSARLLWAAPEHAHDEHEEGGEHDHREHAEHTEERVVHLPESEWAEFGIEVAAAGPGMLSTHVTLPGEVKVNEDHLAHIVPRFAGIATEVRKGIGDHVRKGEVLAVLESNESLSAYEVKSLIDGTVIAKHITLGEALSEDDEAFVVADLGTVWVDFSVYQKDLSSVKVGQSVLVSIGHETLEATGAISYLGPILDEHTRTALARVVLSNADGRWRPGLFVTGRVETGAAETPVVIPHSALQTIENQTCVFVLTDEGFEPRKVTIGRSNATSTEVVSGISPGQRYVSNGAFTLKAELSKAAFGDGHAH